MKCTLNICPEREEEILIFAHKRTLLTDTISALAQEDDFELTGFYNGSTKKLELTDIFCFVSEENRIFAITENEKWQIKTRLYKIEESLPATFVRLNQSCIANIRQIDRFETTFGGALSVVFKNGYTDYISRRQLKTVKERLGIK